MRRVAQDDANGCVVASLAMVTGKTYAQVREEIQKHTGHFDGENYKTYIGGQDFATGGCCAESTVLNYLTEAGFAIQRMYRCDPFTNENRKEWPVLWVKNAPTFRGYIVSTVLNSNAHAVAVTECGCVLDPWREGEYSLADYEAVHVIMAIFELPKAGEQ